MTDISIRPFREEDRSAILEFQNKRRPLHLQETVAEWERNDARRLAGEVYLQLCVGDPPVAYLSISDRSTSAWRRPETCGFGLWVAESQQRQGLGSRLYERAEQFAAERGARKIVTSIRLFRSDEPALPFLAKRGFVEVDREVPVMLDLTAFDPAPHRRPLPDGLHLLSFAEAGDTEEHRRKLHALDARIHPDVPTNDTHADHPAFEDWVKLLDGPEYDPNAVLLAANPDGDWVGLSILGFQEHTTIAWTNITGVLPAYRR
jgi:GNAT superfamily N-acetyltransferase